MEGATGARGRDNRAYLVAVDEHEAAIAALGECIDLVTSLKNSPSLI